MGTSRAIGRVATAGVLTTVLACAAAGPAAAGDGPARTTSGSTSAFLWTGSDDGPGVFFDLFQPPGQDAFANLEVFVGAYECLTPGPVPAEFDPVAGTASATGSLELSCNGFDLPEATGEATFALTFTPGEQTLFRGVDVDGRCLTRSWVRDAGVTGTVTVEVPDLGLSAETVTREAEFRVDDRVCIPEPRPH